MNTGKIIEQLHQISLLTSKDMVKKECYTIEEILDWEYRFNTLIKKAVDEDKCTIIGVSHTNLQANVHFTDSTLKKCETIKKQIDEIMESLHKNTVFN